MYKKLQPFLEKELNAIKEAGLWKRERIITTPQGADIKTQDGRAVINFCANNYLGLSSHPKVIEAIKNQLDQYLHLMVYGEVVQSPQALLAKAISQTLPPSLDNIYFVNSGSEAIEGALKLAKRYTQRSEIIYFENSYHGSSHGALSIMGNEYFKQAFRPLLPNTRMIRLNQIEDLDYITKETACIVLETIQGEAGVRIPDTNYINALATKCKSTGTLLILDEIQTGFGRTGKFWAFEHFDIQPDILVCAKGMGGGMPIGAFISSKTIMNSLTENPVLGHITTFGGHPVSCVASLAVIEILREEKLIEQVACKAEKIKQLLHHPKIKSIRNMGLMMAVEFESYQILKPIIDQAIQLGVLTDWFLHCDNAMRIAPPLTITEQEIEEACLFLLNAIETA
ncbi:MAG: aspartate aminotransferase family protein [Cytophagales bacterium]|nr:MAG: aspartate aminotransferase family protein [Cytophagales bacterium]